MSAFKKLNQQDVFVTTYVARKRWNFTGEELEGAGVRLLPAYSDKPDCAFRIRANYTPADCNFELSAIETVGDCNFEISTVEKTLDCSFNIERVL